MPYLRYHSTLLIVIFWFVVNAAYPSPFDVRIDHHKADIVHDLIINTPRPRFSWKIPSVNDRAQWDSGRIRSSQSIHVSYTGQNDLLPSTYYRFRVRVWLTSSVESISEWTDWIQFRTPIFNLHEYLTKNDSILWIGSTKINMNELRKEFMVPNTSSIKSAIVYISGIGYYELYLNGNNVDLSRKLDPGWTSYEIRTLVASFDLTSNITVRNEFYF
jgi:alpha-L-rhamnosidase